jgi:hypothetical protein
MTSSATDTFALTVENTSLKTVFGVHIPVLLSLFAPSFSTDKLCSTHSLLWALQLRGLLWPLRKFRLPLRYQLMLWIVSLSMPRWQALGSTSGELQVHNYISIIGFSTTLTIHRRILRYLLPDPVGRKVWSCNHVWHSRCHCWRLHFLRHRDPDLGQEVEGQSRTTSGRKLMVL